MCMLHISAYFSTFFYLLSLLFISIVHKPMISYMYVCVAFFINITCQQHTLFFLLFSLVYFQVCIESRKNTKLREVLSEIGNERKESEWKAWMWWTQLSNILRMRWRYSTWKRDTIDKDTRRVEQQNRAPIIIICNIHVFPNVAHAKPWILLGVFCCWLLDMCALGSQKPHNYTEKLRLIIIMKILKAHCLNTHGDWWQEVRKGGGRRGKRRFGSMKQAGENAYLSIP